MLKDFETAAVRHVNVHQQKITFLEPEHLESLVTRGRLTHLGDRRVSFEKLFVPARTAA
jgi:hypothetical protein